MVKALWHNDKKKREGLTVKARWYDDESTMARW
jgi:hypothetical protein